MPDAPGRRERWDPNRLRRTEVVLLLLLAGWDEDEEEEGPAAAAFEDVEGAIADGWEGESRTP